ncbi:MAG: leucine-rich repeat domain-containing protein [Clostridiales bacterium]|nr:leucine-rich repeat domain-containing protein [Clostridiales bacterium]
MKKKVIALMTMMAMTVNTLIPTMQTAAQATAAADTAVYAQNKDAGENDLTVTEINIREREEEQAIEEIAGQIILADNMSETDEEACDEEAGEANSLEEEVQMPTVNAAATVASGTCGDNLTWVLDDDGLLTISGSGEMVSIEETSDIPWYDYRESIITAVVEEGVTTISQYAFLSCSNMTDLTIPASVTSIGDYILRKCTSISVITVSSSNQYYCSEDNVLFDKSQSTLIVSAADKTGSYTVPSTVESISNRAFENCGDLEELIIQKNVTSIGKRVFTNCLSLKSIIVSSDNESYCSVDGVLYSKDKTSLIAYPKALSGSYTIPSGVTKIENWAFVNCTKLTGITIGENVTKIGLASFARCTALTSITIPDSVMTIGAVSFAGCLNLSDVFIGSGVTVIDNAAFVNCYELDTISVPDTVTRVGSYILGYNVASFTVNEEETSITFTGLEKADGIPTIYGYTDSAIETYAAENSLTFITYITNYEVTLASESYTYDGLAKEPEVTVSYGTNVLTKVTDYIVSYDNNVNAGTATVTVTGTGSYAGTVTKTFTISGGSASKEQQTIAAVIAPTSINVNEKATISATAKGALSYSSSNTSVAKVSSSGVVTGISAGTATITIKAAATAEYYAASKTLTIKVNMAGAKVTSLTNTSKGVLIKWGKVAGAKGYYVYRKTEGSSKSKIARCSGNSNVTYTDTKAKNGVKYTYYVYPYDASKTGSCATSKVIVRLTGISITKLTNSVYKIISAKWKKNSAATGYQIWISTSKNFKTSSRKLSLDLSKIKKQSICLNNMKKRKDLLCKSARFSKSQWQEIL